MYNICCLYVQANSYIVDKIENETLEGNIVLRYLSHLLID